MPGSTAGRASVSRGRLWEFVRAGVISEAQCVALLGDVDGVDAGVDADVDAGGRRPAVGGPPPGSKKVKVPREMQWDRFAVRRVALKVAYLGWEYSGFASQVPAPGLRTVEEALFHALVTTRLVRDINDCGYTRCGRTDKGVSALGQVIALDVRSARRKEMSDSEWESAGGHEGRGEIDYVSVLNHALPADIQVLGWAPVGPDFHARFSATWRHYKYVFYGGGLDVEAMQRAARRFLGKHDFRNFCKMDVGNVKSFEREIYECCIVPLEHVGVRVAHAGVDPHDARDMVPGAGIVPGVTTWEGTTAQAQAQAQALSSSSSGMWEFNVRGSAFLWHMVRCMMAVLFMVGEGVESEGVITELLDVSTPGGTFASGKPQYNMANDAPLVLYACGFGDAQTPLFRTPKNSIRNLDRLFFMLMGRNLLKTAVCGTVLAHWSKHLLADDTFKQDREDALDDEARQPLCLHHDSARFHRCLPMATNSPANTHVPLKARPRGLTHDVAVERLHLKKQRLVLQAQAERGGTQDESP